jgi:hypothetical protein
MKPTPAGSSQGLSRVEGCMVMIVSKGGVDVHKTWPETVTWLAALVIQSSFSLLQ